MADDEKHVESDEEDFYEEEVIVTEQGDGRKPVYESIIANAPIIKCIGQLETTYKYNDKNQDYSIKTDGTGTVYRVDKQHTAYIITCAHNVRHRIKECGDCGKWMEMEKIKCEKKTCGSTNLKQTVIAANKIQFNRRNIKEDQWCEKNDEKILYKYGKMEKGCTATCFYLNDKKYNQYPSTKDGYDIAILCFFDSDDYYSKYCKNIGIQDENATIDNIANRKSFFMFGYPAYPKQPDKHGKMKGMESTGNDFEVKKSSKTGEWYLKQQVIDASKGQSGSVLFYVDPKNNPVYVIFAVHTGGNEQSKYNVGSLINQNILQKMQETKALYGHNWVDDTINQDEDGRINKMQEMKEENNEIFECKEEKKDESKMTEKPGGKYNDECCVLVIGITGSGKSSICSLLSGQSVETSSGGKAVKIPGGAQKYSSKYVENLHFVDTMGTRDGSGEKVLKNALRYLDRNKISISKILWCVSGDLDREGPFMPEAEFIRGLQISDEQKQEDVFSVWDSVLILKKNGEPEDTLQGPKLAAKAFGGNFNCDEIDTKRSFGWKCIEWIENNSKKKFPKWLKRLSTDEAEEEGYFKAAVAREIIQKKIDELPIFEFKFERKKCTKCGAKGDSRYVYEPCHTQPELRHSNPISYKHPGGFTFNHVKPLTTNLNIIKYKHHTGWCYAKHAGQLIKYHPGSKKSAKVAKLIYKFRNVFEPIFTSEYWEYYGCCGKYVTEQVPGCCRKWECCGSHESGLGCKNDDASFIWSCCNGEPFSSGCKEVLDETPRYECCGGDEKSKGCYKKWDCGCDLSDTGCKAFFPCCDGDANSDGCKTICANCKISWGQGPGCVLEKN